ncbi:hypothetical protein Acr_13g0010570 [Actinidia rufa]|uniref:Uncharacterized protein n=1 Tax=Actinidia rufa TaxID=165716 RepID=A0A7J0FP11_9ERIC|nr:hypothetical protein Acr_13g0010570 [Actinidia rufa]
MVTAAVKRCSGVSLKEVYRCMTLRSSGGHTIATATMPWTSDSSVRIVKIQTRLCHIHTDDR